MTPDDALERELESLRPRPMSPEVRRQIGGRIRRPWRRRFAVGLAAAGVAAGLIVAVILHRPPASPVEPVPVAEEPVSPSVLAYERAFAKSPAALDTLLDEQSVRTSRDVRPAPSASAGIMLNLLTLKGIHE
jgi:hypothetical protein